MITKEVTRFLIWVVEGLILLRTCFKMVFTNKEEGPHLIKLLKLPLVQYNLIMVQKKVLRIIENINVNLVMVMVVKE